MTQVARSATDRVVVSTVVAVDRTTAFEVFVDEIDLWWRRDPRYRFPDEGAIRFEPGENGRLLVDSGSAVREMGRILLWKPIDRIVFELSSRDTHEATRVEISFEDAAAGTRVTVEHSGWDAVPGEHPARHGLAGPAFIAMMGTWWADLLVSLRTRAVERGPSQT